MTYFRRRRTKLSVSVLLLGASLTLGGCMLDPGVTKPRLSVPARYRATQASAKQVWPSTTWWKDFQSPELDRLITEARTNNLDIAAAAAAVVRADALVRVAGAPLFPSLNAKGSASRTHQSIATSSRYNGSGSSAYTQNSYQATLNASYEVDFWGQNRAALEAQRQSAIATRFDQANVALGVYASVASTYFDIVTLKERLRIAHKNLANAEEVLKIVRAEIAVGTASELELAQQQTTVAQQRAVIPPLEQSLQEDINALAILLGKPPERIHITIDNPSDIAVPRVSAGIPSQLLKRRPDIAEAQANLASQRATVQSDKAALFPTIDLTADGGFESAALHTLLDPASRFYQLAASLSQPLFEGGKLRGQLSADRAYYRELLADYEKSVLSAFQDVDNALVGIHQTTRQERLQAQAVKSARLAFEISKAKLQQGLVGLTTVIQTEQTLFNAQDMLAQDRLARLQATVSLYQALGGGWSRDQALASKSYQNMPYY